MGAEPTRFGLVNRRELAARVLDHGAEGGIGEQCFAIGARRRRERHAIGARRAPLLIIKAEARKVDARRGVKLPAQITAPERRVPPPIRRRPVEMGVEQCVTALLQARDIHDLEILAGGIAAAA